MTLLRVVGQLLAIVLAGSIVLAVLTAAIGSGVAFLWIAGTFAALWAALNDAVREPRPARGARPRPTRSAPPMACPVAPTAEPAPRPVARCRRCGTVTTGLRRCRRCAADVETGRVPELLSS